jgi:hypothetical protein
MGPPTHTDEADEGDQAEDTEWSAVIGRAWPQVYIGTLLMFPEEVRLK